MEELNKNKKLDTLACNLFKELNGLSISDAMIVIKTMKLLLKDNSTVRIDL